MAKRAFCVGINDYPLEKSDLNGCVNDANAWADLLVEHFDFARPDVKVLLDAEATKANMVAGLQNLLVGAQRGDVLVFTNSSHGSYIADKDGDEPNKFDEVICPTDVDAGNWLSDDELRELFAEMADGVRLTVISDSCHSGSITRVILNEDGPGELGSDDRRVRFLNPRNIGQPVVNRPTRKHREFHARKRELHPESTMKEILLSGCKDGQFSFDALIEGGYHGAMTYHAIKAIRAANYQLTYEQLHAELQPMLDEGGYDQHPQLEGADEFKRRQLFT